MGLVKNFFIALSNNTFLNRTAKRIGPALGANKVVAGVTKEGTIETIKKINSHGISCTVDTLGEFVSTREEALASKKDIIDLLRLMHKEGVDAHISVKLSQLGINIDKKFAYNCIKEILDVAKECDNTFVNIDTEKFEDLVNITETLDKLKDEYDNVGTVIQAYLYDALNIMDKYADVRLRLVKGAYKEGPHIAFQTKEGIDKNYMKLIEHRLSTGNNFTSIATHDHNVINYVKQLVKNHNISNDEFEFQMLYGFRTEYAYELAKEGYNFTIYVPYGEDWFGYFMRRLAERPQNINLMLLDIFDKKNRNKLVAGASIVSAASLLAISMSKIFKRK